mgnify:CR=1 FL=1
MSDGLRELYQEVILDHGKNPRNFRHPEAANREAHGNNPMCGDKLAVYLTVDDKGIIRDAAFVGRGCAISTASASMMTEILRGKTEQQAKALFENFQHNCTSDAQEPAPEGLADEAERLEMLSGVRQFPMRLKCATLAWHTMMAAMQGEPVVSPE